MAADYQFVKDMTPEGYSLPSHRLQRTCPSDRIPLVLVACGSFSPITFLHLRMFPMARDHARNEGFEVIGGYLSPVSDAYKKKGLAPASHRIEMCRLGTENTSKWLMVDPWEAENPAYIPTARVLDHFDYEINEVMGGVECSDGTRKRARIMLLAGLDLIQTMSTPGVWDERDLDHILGNYGVFALERSGTDIDSTLANLKQWEKNLHIIRQVVTNDVSSTKVRLLLKRDMSIDYLIPDDVINYVYDHGLYRDLDASFSHSKGKDRGDYRMEVAGPSKG
ncbi:Fc.00g060280.m01.CDS01 [Cosmosporella sp. VM-42]